MWPVLVTTAKSNNVLQGNTVIFSWLRAVQSILINMNFSFPKLEQSDLSKDTMTVYPKLNSQWVDSMGCFYSVTLCISCI